jgi:hypothetical protein
MLHYKQLLPQDLWALRVRVGEALSAAKPPAKRKLIDLRTPRRDLSRLSAAYVSNAEPSSPATPADPPKPETLPPGRNIVKALQGSAVVRDAMIDPDRPDEKLGGEPRSNAVRRAERTNAFLVHFDLPKLGLPRDAKVVKATVNFYVWDPSSKGDTKVCAFPLKTAWNEKTVSWNQPAAGKTWQGGKTFVLEKDAGVASPHVVVKPDMGSDTADPPIEYTLDVTDIVKGWLSGEANYGVAIAPVIDRQIDEGQHTRFQVYASEWRELKQTPKLTVEVKP